MQMFTQNSLSNTLSALQAQAAARENLAKQPITVGAWVRIKGQNTVGRVEMVQQKVAGWMLHYVYLMITGKFVNADTAQVKDIFENMLNEPGVMMFWTMVIILLCVTLLTELWRLLYC